MNKYVKEFIHRGMMFSGFGPIVLGVVYLIVSKATDDFILTGSQICLAITSVYILAFLQAGATVFNQIEHWPLAKSLLCHFLTLYGAYSLCYLINTWIPFDVKIFLIFTLIFVLLYFVIWFTVYASVKATSKKLNKNLK